MSERQPERTGGGDDLIEQEKLRLEAEKVEMQKQIARLQTEIAQAKQRQRQTIRNTAAPQTPRTVPPETIDNSLVAVNTPIYDVFPADAVVRGGGENSQNNFVVPVGAKNVVLIPNAAGRTI